MTTAVRQTVTEQLQMSSLGFVGHLLPPSRFILPVKDQVGDLPVTFTAQQIPQRSYNILLLSLGV